MKTFYAIIMLSIAFICSGPKHAISSTKTTNLDIYEYLGMTEDIINKINQTNVYAKMAWNYCIQDQLVKSLKVLREMVSTVYGIKDGRPDIFYESMDEHDYTTIKLVVQDYITFLQDNQSYFMLDGDSSSPLADDIYENIWRNTIEQLRYIQARSTEKAGEYIEALRLYKIIREYYGYFLTVLSPKAPDSSFTEMPRISSDITIDEGYAKLQEWIELLDQRITTLKVKLGLDEDTDDATDDIYSEEYPVINIQIIHEDGVPKAIIKDNNSSE